MTKILKSKFKASRRLGVSIWGSDNDSYHKRNYRPGQHGLGRGGKLSDYGLHLRAKQRIKAHYGNIKEKQLKNIFALARKMKGNTEENFMMLLERRLDVTVYRLNFAPTIFAARQLVSHKHFKVNGSPVNIPSLRLNDGDEIELMEPSKNIPMVKESVDKISRPVPEYLTLDSSKKGKVIRGSQVNDIPIPFDLQLQLVVEYYSK